MLTRRQVQGLVVAMGAPPLPWKVFSRGHSCPLSFLADAYNHPGDDMAAWASRSGIKTLSASILAALEFGRDRGLKARVLSGSAAQAENLYGYWSNWCDSPMLRGLLDGPPLRLLTKIHSGRFEILAASQTQVRGPKVQRLYEDELDEIDVDLDRAAAGMISSRENMPGRTVYTSTWHRVDGPMGALVEKCPGNGVTLHRWNFWESLAKCPQERHRDGVGCVSCPFGEPCLSKRAECLRHGIADGQGPENVGIAANCCGLYQIEDVLKAYRKVGRATWETEYLCLRPSVEGLVYPSFDPRVHGVAVPPKPLTAVYRSIDWGYNSFVCLWIGVDEDGIAYVLDTYAAAEGTVAQHARYILAHPLRAVVATFCDPAGNQKNDQTGESSVIQLRKLGIECSYTYSPVLRTVANGVKLIRDMLEPISGEPRLKYLRSKNNEFFVKCMQAYRNRRVNDQWIDEPQKPQEFDHVPDALRYWAVNYHERRTADEKQARPAPLHSLAWYEQQDAEREARALHSWKR